MTSSARTSVLAATLASVISVGGYSAAETLLDDATDPQATVAQESLDDAIADLPQGSSITAALEEALELLPANGTHLSERQVIRIPPGRWVLDDPDGDGTALKITRRVILDGQGAALIVPLNVTAIELALGASWSRVERLTIEPADRFTPHDGVGIVIRGHAVRLDDVIVREMGVGIHLDGVGANNVNAAQLWRLVVYRCWDTQVWIQGGDGNAYTMVGAELEGGEVALQDDSFLGGTSIGVTVHATTGPALRLTAGAQYGTYLGTYVEADTCTECPNGYFDTIDSQSPLATFVGGGAVPFVRNGARVGLGVSRLRFSDAMPSGERISVLIPHASVSSGVTIQRLTPNGGQVIEGLHFPRYVDNLNQTRFTVYGGGVADDGLTAPFGYLSASSQGFGQARVDAQHFSQGNPSGYAVEHAE